MTSLGERTSGDLGDVAGQIAGCRICPELAASRHSTVPGQFPLQARLLLVGEAPGADEDRQGQPFVGRSGQLLDTLLTAAGLPRATVAVANVVKCRPPANRAPRAREVAACRPFLQQQLSLADPLLVMCLGGTATRWFFGRSVRLTSLRGSVHTIDGRHLMVTYHPSAALRFGPNGQPMHALRDDLLAAAAWLGAPSPR